MCVLILFFISYFVSFVYQFNFSRQFSIHSSFELPVTNLTNSFFLGNFFSILFAVPLNPLFVRSYDNHTQQYLVTLIWVYDSSVILPVLSASFFYHKNTILFFYYSVFTYNCSKKTNIIVQLIEYNH